MNEITKQKLLNALTEKIEEIIDETDNQTLCDLPIMGYSTALAMANAALQVLIGIKDAQEYLREDGILIEEPNES